MVHVPSPDFHVELVPAGAKKATAEADARSRDLHMVPIGNIKVVSDFNVRIQDAEWEKQRDSVKESIKANGFFAHMPLKGYAGKEGDVTFIYCTGGFTRLEAAKLAAEEGTPIESLPVVLSPPGTNMIDLMLGLDTDNTGNRLRPYERGIVAKRAMGFGATEEDVAKRMGVSLQYVKNILFLMSLPNGLQQQVVSGRVSADTVIQLARKEGSAEALKKLEAATPATGEPDSKPVAQRRVTPRNIGTEKKIPYKTLVDGVKYALDLPNGLDFLKRFLAQEKDAVKELRVFLKPPKAKATKGKAKVVDPFDISPRKRTAKPELRKTAKEEAEAPL